MTFYISEQKILSNFHDLYVAPVSCSVVSRFSLSWVFHGTLPKPGGEDEVDGNGESEKVNDLDEAFLGYAMNEGNTQIGPQNDTGYQCQIGQ